MLVVGQDAELKKNVECRLECWKHGEKQIFLKEENPNMN